MKFRLAEENNEEVEKRFKEVILIVETLKSMNNEYAYYDTLWLIPDEAEYEDLKDDFATDRDAFEELVREFNRVYKKYHDDGLADAPEVVEEYAHKKDKELELEPIENLKPNKRVVEGETKAEIEKTAKRLNYPKSQIVKSDKDNYFLAPRGIKSSGAKKAYANCREDSEDKEKCSKIAWSIEKKNEGLDFDNLEDVEKFGNNKLNEDTTLNEGIWFLPFKQEDVDEIREVLSKPITYQELLDSPVAIVGSDDFYDGLEYYIVENPDGDARDFIRRTLAYLVKDYRERENSYTQKASEEILKQLEELAGMNRVKVEKKVIEIPRKDKTEEIVEKTEEVKEENIKEDFGPYDCANSTEKYKDRRIAELIVGDKVRYIVLSRKALHAYKTKEQAKEFIDELGEDETQSEIHELNELQNKELNETIKEITPENFSITLDEETKKKAKELADNIDPTEYLDNEYKDYREFLDKEFVVKVLGETRTEEEKDELIKWFEDGYEKKTKVVKRLFGGQSKEFTEKYTTDESIFEGLESDVLRDDEIDKEWENIEIKADTDNFSIPSSQPIILNQPQMPMQPQMPVVPNIPMQQPIMPTPVMPNQNIGVQGNGMLNNGVGNVPVIDEFQLLQQQSMQQTLQDTKPPLAPTISAPMTNIQPSLPFVPETPNLAFNNLTNVSAVRKDDVVDMQVYGQNPVANYAPNPNNLINMNGEQFLDMYVDNCTVRDDEF